MKKNNTFVLRLSTEDRQLLERLAERTKRSKSAVFRWALYEVAPTFDTCLRPAISSEFNKGVVSGAINPSDNNTDERELV